jgi:hypothetical protein
MHEIRGAGVKAETAAFLHKAREFLAKARNLLEPDAKRNAGDPRFYRHSRESGNPEQATSGRPWTPAFAGATV